MTQNTKKHKLTLDGVKANYVYARELLQSTKEEFEGVRYTISRNLQNLGGRQGVVIGRSEDDELITLVDIKSNYDFKSALVYVSDYIANADTKTLKLTESKANAAFESLTYLEGIFPRFSELMTARSACKKYIKGVNKLREGQGVVPENIIRLLEGFAPDKVTYLCDVEKKNTETVLYTAVADFYKTRLRNMKDEEADILDEMLECIEYAAERGFKDQLIDWDYGIDDYIRRLFIFSDSYVEDGRVSKGLKARVNRLHDLTELRRQKKEDVKACALELENYLEDLKVAGYRIESTF